MKLSVKFMDGCAFLLSLTGCILYILLINNNNLWMDEAFSAVLVKGSLSQVLERSAADTLPPLYNVLNWCFSQLFGFHPWALRLASALPMCGCFILSFFYVRKRLGSLCCLIFSACLAGMPQLCYYGGEIRMYALSLFFVTLCGCGALELTFNEKSRAGCIFLVMGALLSGYTHHFALVCCGMIYLMLMIYSFRMRRIGIARWAVMLAVTIALYLPCFVNTLAQMRRVQGYFDMPDIDSSLAVSCLKLPFVTGNTLLTVLLFTAFALMFMLCLTGLVKAMAGNTGSLKTRCLIRGLCCTLVYPMVMVFGFAAALLLHTNIFSERYLVPSLGLLWLGFSIVMSACISSLNEYLRSGAVYDLMVLLLAVSIFDYADQYGIQHDARVEDMTRIMGGMIEDGDRYIIADDENYELEICFRYYFPGLEKTDFEKEDGRSGHLWYVARETDSKKAAPPHRQGYRSMEKGRFFFDRYSFTLYEMGH